jgi:hypothetical protein
VTTMLDRLHSALLLVCCLALFANGSCHREAGTNALFPSSNEAAGWIKSSDIRTFEAVDLWKYIDGDAERYAKAGVERVFTSDYKYQNKIDAVVDIYTMANAEGSKRIFESEPAGDARPVQLGDSARLYSQSLIFRRGSYLVRIVAYQESAETPQALFQLGWAIEGRVTR